MPALEKIALDELLCGKILPHLHSIHGNVHESILRTERVIASLYDVWTGPSVTEDRRYELIFYCSLSLSCSSPVPNFLRNSSHALFLKLGYVVNVGGFASSGCILEVMSDFSSLFL